MKKWQIELAMLRRLPLWEHKKNETCKKVMIARYYSDE